MTDVYYRDTKKAFEDFDAAFSDISLHFNDEIQEGYDILRTEMGLLLDQYKEKTELIEKLEEKIEELENDLAKHR